MNEVQVLIILVLKIVSWLFSIQDYVYFHTLPHLRQLQVYLAVKPRIDY